MMIISRAEITELTEKLIKVVPLSAPKTANDVACNNGKNLTAVIFNSIKSRRSGRRAGGMTATSRRPGVHLLPIYESARTYIPPPGPVSGRFFFFPSGSLPSPEKKKRDENVAGRRGFLFSGSLGCVAMPTRFENAFPLFSNLEPGRKEKRKEISFLTHDVHVHARITVSRL